MRASNKFNIRIVRNLEDMMQITAIRAATYIAEQQCPYEEEFDGNDLCSMHLIAARHSEPVACLRMRFFADFAKIERLAVIRRFRRSQVAFEIVRHGIGLCKQKGYVRIYGHAQDRLVDFWTRFGARPMQRNSTSRLTFSDFGYTEMLLETAPDPRAVTLASDPYEIIRPEGAWDQPGILERSVGRGATSPLGGIAA